ncbi:hypothetical protein P43SY_010926 [Pythium insidiosum]|uniref:IPT/TIG domain-containing protein n=1 Tax=Pythium insidiosum TaxID=114742 RepID=A0AAD5L930_PYTIN|nr:hypothetical protein P43SY_010926 [Pythium insidiosum]
MQIRFSVNDGDVDAVETPLARFISSEEVTVSVPSHQMERSGGGPVMVIATINSFDVSNALVFVYRARAELLSVAPSVIRVNQPPAELVVSGRNFAVENRDSIYCQIGESDVLLRATWLSDTTVRCPVPRLAAGWHRVQITDNNATFVNDDLMVLYRDTLVLQSLSPPLGPIEGGTLITQQPLAF